MLTTSCIMGMIATISFISPSPALKIYKLINTRVKCRVSSTGGTQTDVLEKK